jgi:hypothetical protein
MQRGHDAGGEIALDHLLAQHVEHAARAQPGQDRLAHLAGIRALLAREQQRLGRTQGFFDAEGDRIPPDPLAQGGLADMTTVNLLGKLGLRFGERRLELSANRYDAGQDTDFVAVPGVVGQRKATTAPGTPPGKGQGTENTVVSLNYDHGTVGSSRVTGQAYYQDYFTRFGFSSFFPGGGGQSLLLSKKHGVRLDVETPFAPAAGTRLLWGLDYLVDRTSQPLEDGRIWVPEMDQTSVAPFAQLETRLGSRWLVRTGVRHEDIRVEVDDFTTLFGGNFVRGGELGYDATLFNAGVVFYPSDGLSLYANYSQGFSVAEVGRELRGTTASSVTALKPEAQEVDHYELGLRHERGRIVTSVALFYSESELGVTFGPAPDFRIRREPERIHGVEGTLDVALASAWRAGGSVTWMEGKRDTNNDGSYDRYLPGDRIPRSSGSSRARRARRWRRSLIWHEPRIPAARPPSCGCPRATPRRSRCIWAPTRGRACSSIPIGRPCSACAGRARRSRDCAACAAHPALRGRGRGDRARRGGARALGVGNQRGGAVVARLAPAGRRPADPRRGWLRTCTDLHRVAGVLSLVFLLISGVTGAALVFHEAFTRALFGLTGTAAPAPAAHMAAAGERLSLDEIVRRAEAALPEGRITWLYLPLEPDQAVIVRKKLPEELHPNGRNFAHVDPYRGEIVHVRSSRAAPLAVRIDNLVYPLHIGAAGGFATRVIQSAVGVLLAVLVLAGLVMWGMRARMRRHGVTPRQTGGFNRDRFEGRP